MPRFDWMSGRAVRPRQSHTERRCVLPRLEAISKPPLQRQAWLIELKPVLYSSSSGIVPSGTSAGGRMSSCHARRFRGIVIIAWGDLGRPSGGEFVGSGGALPLFPTPAKLALSYPVVRITSHGQFGGKSVPNDATMAVPRDPPRLSSALEHGELHFTGTEAEPRICLGYPLIGGGHGLCPLPFLLFPRRVARVACGFLLDFER